MLGQVHHHPLGVCSRLQLGQLSRTIKVVCLRRRAVDDLVRAGRIVDGAGPKNGVSRIAKVGSLKRGSLRVNADDTSCRAPTFDVLLAEHTRVRATKHI